MIHPPLLAFAALLAAASPQSDDEALAAMIDLMVERELAAGRVPGAAVAVVRGGKLVFARGYGLADLEAETPVVAEQTLFRIGSVTKVFTALALTQAIDDGLIAYDDPIAPLLGDLEIDNPYDEPVRVRHLLTHTAGFDQIGTGRQVEDPALRPPLDAFLTDQLRVVNPPGTVSCYDTYGITLAGYVLEQLSERSYSKHVRARIFERGEGETLASGTGSTACVVAARLLGRVAAEVEVALPGGRLNVTWQGEGEPAFLEGPAVEVFEGEWPASTCES